MGDNQEQKKSTALETLFCKACDSAEDRGAEVLFFMVPIGMTTWVDDTVKLATEVKDLCLN